MPYPYYRDPENQQQQPQQPASQYNTPYIMGSTVDPRNTGDLLMEQLTLVEYIRREQAQFQERTYPMWARYTANLQDLQARRLAHARAAEDARRAQQEERWPYVGPPQVVRPHRVYSHPLDVGEVQTDRLPPDGRDG